jgi:N-acetylneuraminic acid mutarotase
LFGGWDGERYLDVAYVYDPVIDGWRPLPSMTIARAHATGGVITGQLYVVGGFDGEAELAQCQLFEPATETWSGCPSMLLPRAGAGATVLVNKLYVIGGGLQADNEVRFSEFYDPKAETWQVVNTPMLADSPGWVNLGITNVETHIYALGGRRDGQLRTDNYVFAPFVYQTFIPAASSGGDN